MTKVRCYMGVFIYPCEPNSSGMRWWAFTREGIVRADTLDGVRELIKRSRQ